MELIRMYFNFMQVIFIWPCHLNWLIWYYVLSMLYILYMIPPI